MCIITEKAAEIKSSIADVRQSTPETERATTTDSDDTALAVQSLEDAVHEEHQIPIKIEDHDEFLAPVDKPPTPMPE